MAERSPPPGPQDVESRRYDEHIVSVVVEIPTGSRNKSRVRAGQGDAPA